MGNDWATVFTPVERHASADIERVANSFQWLLYANAGLMSLTLFLVAANRSRNGDSTGAFFAAIGAVVCATAPLIAKSFSIGV